MQELLGLLREGLHSLLVHTIQTMEETGRTVCDVTSTGPWEDTMDLARQVWDKSRHIEIFLQLLEHVEGYGGEALATTVPGHCADAEPALTGQSCAVLARLIELAQKIGDSLSERALDVVLAEASMWERKDQPYAVA